MTPPRPAEPLSPYNGFLTHKYLLVAMVECLQQQHQRAALSAAQRGGASIPRWAHHPSVEREHTPCLVMREHHDRGDLSVRKVALERLGTEPLADWMRRLVPASREPDQDTVHMAMAPTLPGVPILVHSIGGNGERFTHLFSDGVWSVCQDDHFLLRAIRYAQLVATAIPLSSALVPAARSRAPTPQAMPEEQDAPCDLITLGRVFDHIGVHAAIAELRAFRRTQGRPCVPASGG
jgi:hypothetical protein